MSARTGIAGAAFAALLVVALLAVPARADATLVLEPEDVPGLSPAGTGKGAARGALGSRAPGVLRRAPTEGAAFRSAGKHLKLGAFTLANARQAKQALHALARGGGDRKLEIGDGGFQRLETKRGSATATVVARVGEAIGAVSLQGGGGAAGVASGARAYAEALVARMLGELEKGAWERTLDGIGKDGSITPRVALRAFAIAYGSLPGVPRPKKDVGTPESATLAMQLVARVWDQLTPEQQAAIDVALGAPHDPSSAVPARTSAQVLTPDPGYQALADKYNAMFRARIPGVPPLEIRVFKASEDITDAKTGAKAWADALPVNAAGQWGIGAPGYCRVRVPPFGQAEAGKPFFELVMAHETFHCIQAALMANWRQRSAWIIEGMADWAAVTIYPTTAAVGAGPYRHYLQTPTDSLLERSYNATGFWARVHETNGNLWSLVPSILNAGTDAASFDASGGNTGGFLQSWASAMWRFANAPAPWRQLLPYPISFITLPLPHAPITGTTGVDSAAYTTKHYRINPVAGKPLVSIQPLAGFMRAGTFTTDYGPTQGEEFFCFGKCKCPPNKVSSIPPHLKVAGNKMFLALTGGSLAASGRVEYHDLDKFCKKKEQPKPDRADGPASSNGDPHLTSLDNLHFDFQAAGEFILVRSDSGDLEIQARQEQWKNSNLVTVNTQFAMRVGGRRVTVSSAPNEDEEPVVRIDGNVDALPEGTTRNVGGGFVSRDFVSGYTEVVWPDGSNIVVRPVGSYGVAARIALAPGRAGAVSGMLGNFDGKAGNDLARRGGGPIDYRLRESGDWGAIEGFRILNEFDRRFFDDLYDIVGDSWRISQQQSLFDYGAGETTQTFTKRPVPKRPFGVEDIPEAERRKAERICRRRGVSEDGPLRDCILDMFITGEVAFADDAAAAEEALSAAWTRLRAGANRVGFVSLLQAADGTLHVGFAERTTSFEERMVSVPIDVLGNEGATETIEAVGSEPSLLAGPGGEVRALSAQLPSTGPSGIYQHRRNADGSWSNLGNAATGGYTYASRPSGLFVDGTLFSLAPMAGVAEIFRGAPAGAGAPLPPEGCYATSPVLAQDGASGALWVAWVQWDCPTLGVFVQQVDTATGALIGTPQKAPGSTWTRDGVEQFPDVALNESLAFTGRPGTPGVYLAFPADTRERIVLWRVGDAGAQSVPKRRKPIGRLMLTADPAGGRMWLGWSEEKRLWLKRTTGDGTLEGSQFPLDPPTGSNAPLLSFHHWDIAARAGGLDVLYGFMRDSETLGGLWHTRIVE